MPRRGSLASKLASAARQFEKSQITHFREALGPHVAEEVVETVLTMTRSLFQSGSGMVTVPKSGLAASLTTAMVEGHTPPGRLHAQIELEIARSFSLATDELTERCVELAQIALSQKPGDAVARYLQRLGRCYIAGFSPETVIICRAVLENAVIEKFAHEGKPLPTPPPGKSEMFARLSRAEDHQWLTRKQVNEARSIWERGSKAAHRDPNVTSAVLDTVRKTMELLRVLYA